MRSFVPRLLVLSLILAAVSACGQSGPAPAQPTAASQQPTTSAPVATTAPAATTAAATVAPTATTPPTVTPAPTATTAPSPAPTEDPAANAPTGSAARDLLLESSRAQLAQPAFRATINSKDADGNDQVVVLERVIPDSFHMVAGDSEFIIMAEGTFIREANGPWQKSPVNMSGMISQILSEQSIETTMEEVEIDDLRLVGVDVIDGRPTWVYEYNSQTDVGGTTVDVVSKTWIGIADKLPYRVEAVSKTGAEETTSIVTYEYDESITIEAPEVSG